MTYVLVSIQLLPAADNPPRYEVQDLDATGGYIRLPAGTNSLEIHSRNINNDEARAIRKAIESGCAGDELAAVIQQALLPPSPDKTPSDEPPSEAGAPLNPVGEGSGQPAPEQSGGGA